MSFEPCQYCPEADKEMEPRDHGSNRQFLMWIRERLIHVYNENQNADFIHRLSRIINGEDS